MCLFGGLICYDWIVCLWFGEYCDYWFVVFGFVVGYELDYGYFWY